MAAEYEALLGKELEQAHAYGWRVIIADYDTIARDWCVKGGGADDIAKYLSELDKYGDGMAASGASANDYATGFDVERFAVILQGAIISRLCANTSPNTLSRSIPNSSVALLSLRTCAAYTDRLQQQEYPQF